MSVSVPAVSVPAVSVPAVSVPAVTVPAVCMTCCSVLITCVAALSEGLVRAPWIPELQGPEDLRHFPMAQSEEDQEERHILAPGQEEALSAWEPDFW